MFVLCEIGSLGTSSEVVLNIVPDNRYQIHQSRPEPHQVGTMQWKKGRCVLLDHSL